jgi:hypothetical protein
MADAMMTMPSGLDDDTVARLRDHFSVDQLIELSVDVMKWNYQKVMVAMDTHPEVVPGQLADLIFDEQGNWVRPG